MELLSEEELAVRYWKWPEYYRHDTYGRQEATLRVPEEWTIDFDSLERARVLNEIYKYERSASGELVISLRAAPFIESQLTNSVLFQLYRQREPDDPFSRGLVFTSKSMFDFPDTSIMSPSLSWIPPELLPPRDVKPWWDSIESNPTFVVEHCSCNDSPERMHRKMKQYIANGVLLGWLVDAWDQRVYVYRAGREMQTIEKPLFLSGDDVVPGFEVDLSDAWTATKLGRGEPRIFPPRENGGFVLRVRLPETWHLPLETATRMADANPQYKIDRTMLGDLIVACY